MIRLEATKGVWSCVSCASGQKWQILTRGFPFKWAFIKERRKLKFSVKKYDEVPVVHGWSLRRPIKVWHVAHCRWREKFFDWSPENYVKVDELSKDPVTLDVAKLFDSYFEHLWIVSSPISNLQFDFDPSQSAPRKK